jgi:hypothetical protein
MTNITLLDITKDNGLGRVQVKRKHSQYVDHRNLKPGVAIFGKCSLVHSVSIH